MAEPLSITAGIGSTLSFLGHAYNYARNVSGASSQAQQVAEQLLTTKSLLTTLKHTLSSEPRPRHFIELWAPTTGKIVASVRTTIQQLGNKIGSDDGLRSSSTVNLSAWDKMTWPLEREETLALQHQLSSYIQMLSMVQNAFAQGTAAAAQQYARDVEDKLTVFDPSCFSTTVTLIPDSEPATSLQIAPRSSNLLNEESRNAVVRKRSSIFAIWKGKSTYTLTKLDKLDTCFETSSVTIPAYYVKVFSKPVKHPPSTSSPHVARNGGVLHMFLVGNSDYVTFQLESEDGSILRWMIDFRRDPWPRRVVTPRFIEEWIGYAVLESAQSSHASVVICSAIASGVSTSPVAEGLLELHRKWKPWHEAGSPNPSLLTSD